MHKTTLLCALLTLVLTGCAGKTHVGTVGPIDFYSLSDANALAPSYTALVAHEEGVKVGVVRVYGQRGWFPELFAATLDAAGDVGASAVRWHKYKPDIRHGDSISVSGGSSSSHQAQGQLQGQKQKQKQKQKQRTQQEQRQQIVEGDDDGDDPDCYQGDCD